jgi:hypothetical protein
MILNFEQENSRTIEIDLARILDSVRFFILS